MLKQTFDNTAIAKVLTPEDVWRWDLWSKPEEKEGAIEALENSIQAKNFNISALKLEKRRGKATYQANNIEDAITIRLLDRYIRRIYKVRQSDRNRVIRQVKTVLRDSGDYTVMRLDIKQCYESIDFEASIKKLENDMILAPSCIRLLNSISSHCKNEGLKLDVQVFPSHCHQTLTFTQQNNTLMMLLALSALNLCQSYVFLMASVETHPLLIHLTLSAYHQDLETLAMT